MDDASGGRNDAEIVERALAPFQEFVPLLIAFELLLGVDRQRDSRCEGIHLHAVIDHQVARHQRIDFLRDLFLAGHFHDGVAHRREIDDRGHTGEILEHDTGAGKGNLDLADLAGVVFRHRADVFIGDDEAIEVAQAGLEQNLDAIRKVGDLRRWNPRNVHRIQAIHGARAKRRFDRLTGIRKGIGDGHFEVSPSSEVDLSKCSNPVGSW